MAVEYKHIEWGIIGCGDVTEVKSGPAFQKAENSSLVAVMRRNAHKAANYAKRHNVPKWFSNADELISDPAVNAIYVATPPASHAQYAIKAMQAGKPVYVEKPMALNANECKQMIEVSEKMGQPLFVAYYRRFLPGFLKVKELIKNDEIGKIRSVNIQLNKALQKNSDNNWRINPDIAGGGLFFDLASHQLDYLNFLFGNVQSVKSIAVNQGNSYKAEDHVSAIFAFQNNIICTGAWNFSSSVHSETDEIEILGDKGIIKFSTFAFEPISLINDNGQSIFEYSKPKHVQQNMIQAVVNSLTGNGPNVENCRSAMQTNLLMDLVVKDYYKTNRKLNIKQ